MFISVQELIEKVEKVSNKEASSSLMIAHVYEKAFNSKQRLVMVSINGTDTVYILG